MNDKILKLLTGLVLLCSTLSLSAQTIFDVELVFFKRMGELHLTGQQQPIMLESSDNQFTLSNTEAVLPQGVSLLARNEQRLEGVFHRLRSSQDMRPLLHIGWRQTLEDKEDTPWLSFNLQDTPEAQGLIDFQGIIRLSRNQGLVLESQIVGFKEAKTAATDTLELTPQESDDSNELDLPFQASAEDAPAADPELDENMQIPDELNGFFEMSETLKVKLDKLYYIDHPTMGLLVKVTPYQATIEEQEALN